MKVVGAQLVSTRSVLLSTQETKILLCVVKSKDMCKIEHLVFLAL